MMEHGIWEWAGFLAFVVAMLVLDLGVLHRKDHVIRPREALGWSALWIALALAFGGYVWHRHGGDAGLEYLTGYVIEKSLSIDNLFVFVVVFGALGIPSLYQHRVLFWGIVSALVLRGVMIAGGAVVLERFHWIIYVFGALLVARASPSRTSCALRCTTPRSIASRTTTSAAKPIHRVGDPIDPRSIRRPSFRGAPRATARPPARRTMHTRPGVVVKVDTLFSSCRF